MMLLAVSVYKSSEQVETHICVSRNEGIIK